MTIWFQSGRTLDALVGVGGLEQTVYIALTNGNVGEGLIAGLAMAVIAIIAERMTNG
jgi:glycine betaine/proline transport system permease protein